MLCFSPKCWGLNSGPQATFGLPTGLYRQALISFSDRVYSRNILVYKVLGSILSMCTHNAHTGGRGEHKIFKDLNIQKIIIFYEWVVFTWILVCTFQKTTIISKFTKWGGDRNLSSKKILCGFSHKLKYWNVKYIDFVCFEIGSHYIILAVLELII